MELVGSLAEDAMSHAMSEIKALPEYDERGEVSHGETCISFSFSLSFFFISGLLLMQGMILQQMPITAQFCVFQEDISFICLSFTS